MPAGGWRVNLPNYMTLTRIFSVPVLIWILSSHLFNGVRGGRELLACSLFIAASITDGLDGYLARRRGQITTLGTLLDPLADKLMITAAYITLVQFNPAMVPAWIAVHLIARMAIWFMVAISLVSAIDYFAAFWSKIDRTATTRRRRRTFVLSRPKRFGIAPGPLQPRQGK
jgi:phosphatidylglycerophosphate synthase